MIRRPNGRPQTGSVLVTSVGPPFPQVSVSSNGMDPVRVKFVQERCTTPFSSLSSSVSSMRTMRPSLREVNMTVFPVLGDTEAIKLSGPTKSPTPILSTLPVMRVSTNVYSGKGGNGDDIGHTPNELSRIWITIANVVTRTTAFVTTLIAGRWGGICLVVPYHKKAMVPYGGGVTIVVFAQCRRRLISVCAFLFPALLLDH